MPTPIDENIRKQAFWLYGVIVGLAIKEALTNVLPHVFRASKAGEMGQHMPEVVRLVLFLILSVRFYLGATQYFDEAFEKIHPRIGSDGTITEENQYRRKSFGLDFIVGFFHFLVFSALALSITYDETAPNEISNLLFPVILLIILLYDLVWLVLNWKNDTFPLIKLWATLNTITVIFSAVCYFLVWLYYVLQGLQFNSIYAEMIALVPVFLVSVLDIAELIIGKPVIRHFLSWLGNKITSLGSKDAPATS